MGTVNSCSCATALAYTHCLRKNKSLVWQLLLLLFFAAVSYSSLSFCVFHSSLRWHNCKMHEGQMLPAGWPWRRRGKEHGRSWGWHSVLCTHKSTWICPKQPTPSSCSLQRWGCCGIAASPAQHGAGTSRGRWLTDKRLGWFLKHPGLIQLQNCSCLGNCSFPAERGRVQQRQVPVQLKWTSNVPELGSSVRMNLRTVVRWLILRNTRDLHFCNRTGLLFPVFAGSPERTNP